MRLPCAEKREEEHSITFLVEETGYLVQRSNNEEDLSITGNFSFSGGYKDKYWKTHSPQLIFN